MRAVNNQAMAETSSVAALAMHKLGLQQSVSSFLNTYTYLVHHYPGANDHRQRAVG